MTLPAPPNFLAMALQLQQQRRQQEQDRLQQMLQIEQMEENSISQGLQGLQAGMPLKDVTGSLRFKSDRVLSTLSGFDKAMKVKKEQAEAGQQAQSAAGAFSGLMQAAGGDSSQVNPQLANELKFQTWVNTLQAGGDPSQALSNLDLGTAVTANQSMITQRRAQQEAEMRSQRKIGEALTIKSGSLSLEQEAKQRDEERQKSISYYSNLLSDAMISEHGAKPEDISKLESAVLDDPVLGGKNARSSMNLIQMEALSAARANQPAAEIQSHILENTGVRVSPRIADLIISGKAVEDPFTGLPMNLPTDEARRRLGNTNAALEAIADARAAAIRVASRNVGGNAFGVIPKEALVNPMVRSMGLGTDDPDLQAYSSARDAAGELVTLALTGQQAAEAQAQRLMGILPKISELRVDPKNGGLDRISIRRIQQAFDLTMNLISGSSMVSLEKTQEQYHKMFESKVAERIGADNARFGETAIPKGSKRAKALGLE